MDHMNAILISDILPYYQLVLAADRNRAMIQLDNVIQGRWLHYWADYKHAPVIGVKRQVEISNLILRACKNNLINIMAFYHIN